MDPNNQVPLLASASAYRKKIDVFISFRGEDTRNNFTSHLHTALVDKNIDTFIDDKLVRGDEISQALLDAIEDSHISIIIFSKNYANSSWCLDELVHILRCKEKNNQIVLPIFYHITPSDVRKQQGSYADAFAKLEERFKDQIIHKWRAALAAASNLSGWDQDPSNTRSDSELVESIVKDIMEKLRKLNPTSSSDHSKGLVGIDKCIEDIKSLLSHAPIVGIWGMGGLGKTTLANAIFKEFHPQFERHYFLANVREEMERHGATYLRKLFFGELSKEKDLDLGNLQYLKQRLCHKKLLIVLDDVDDLKQYEDLVEDWDWLDSESRVLITSRDQQVLRNIINGVNDQIYNIKELNENDALQLFCLYAFKRNFPAETYTEMSKKFVNYAQGVPLALKVLGSHLHTKRKEEWVSAYNKLKKAPNKRIVDVLKISFNGLDNKQKEIFLDIACFFQGHNKDDVKNILDDGGCFVDVIRDLVDKSLITVDNYKLRVHDLLQEMSWEIARGYKEFGKHSRLWVLDHIFHVLKNNTGTAKIEGIFLNYDYRNTEKLHLEPDVFQKMPSLRLLKIDSSIRRFHFPQGLHSFPDALRYLKWHDYPLNSLGSHFTPCNLVKLEMPFSKLEKLWNEFQPGPQNLRYVNLSFSKNLTCLPDLFRSNLRRLNLEGCTSLVELPPLRFQNVLTEEETKQIDNHVEFIRDEIYGEEYSFSNYEHFGNIELLDSQWKGRIDDYILDLQGCSNLKTLSKMSANRVHICLRSTAIEELHSSIWSVNNLVVIDLKDCKYLKNLPSSICNLGSLEYLEMGGCSSINKFPELPKNIRAVNLSRTSIVQVSESSFKCLPHLNILYMNNCTQLKSLPKSICELKSLMRLCLSGCSQMESFPEILKPMENLKDLVLEGTRIIEIPSSIHNLVMLETLILRGCKNLKYVPANIYNMCNLDYLVVYECPNLQSFPYHSFSSLQVLDPSGTTTVELPFCISQMLCEFKCRGSCAGKSVFFVLTYLDEFNPSVGSASFTQYWYEFWKRLLYCECLIFYTIHNILMTQYFLYEVLIGEQDFGHPRIIFCYSGNSIPQWFTYQSMGSSIDVSLSPLPQSIDFLGFALCIVVDIDHCFSDPKHFDIGCKCRFKTDNGEIAKYDWTLQKEHVAHSDDDSNLESNVLDWSSDLVFIWNLYTNCLGYYFPTGAVFEFYVRQSVSEDSKLRIKQCGIRKLFRQDARKLDFIEHVPRY
ncbi:TIR-NBS-LRR-like protein [Trema orientale]|uniref:ADP-ribosyl cyclase/cyclic ADP-ribose hydrolase n=1 Tax=Trema orientale TaxID=63057 RepID=A0A2P5D3N3_TREOI|nr:TIR-NBS-LRR-like protein [Trema orientale]